MSDQPTTSPDWNAARKVAKESIAMAKLILKAVNAPAKKLAAPKSNKTKPKTH